MVGSSGRNVFMRHLRAVGGLPDHPNDCSAGAIGGTAGTGTTWRLWATPDREWFEIGDERDGAAAVALLETS